MLVGELFCNLRAGNVPVLTCTLYRRERLSETSELGLGFFNLSRLTKTMALRTTLFFAVLRPTMFDLCTPAPSETPVQVAELGNWVSLCNFRTREAAEFGN